MKHLILIGGSMGVGKTATSLSLSHMLPRNVFLDGDSCWKMTPFTVNEETKAMVMDNITHLLGNFIRCSTYEAIIFCWVMHEQTILDEILSRIPRENLCIHAISLICSEEALRTRLAGDIAAGIRQPDVIERSVERLPLYQNLNTVKIDTTALSPEEAAEKIKKLL